MRGEGLTDREPGNINQARDMIAEWVNYYNNQRLHAALQYLRPVDYYRGDPEALLAARRRKLAEAAERREERLKASDKTGARL